MMTTKRTYYCGCVTINNNTQKECSESKRTNGVIHNKYKEGDKK
tara:strand:- start:2276 stop:2407 length:132 start_codon:yes stop_codon:yes gene_type:complete